LQNPPTSPVEQLQWLVDRAAIGDLQAAYGRYLDEKRFDEWQDLFTEDAVLHMPYESIAQPELAAAAHRVLDYYPGTQHLLGQSYIEITGDTATGRRYLSAVHVPGPDNLKDHADLGGWYDHAYRRTGEGWRFSEIRATFIWLAGADFRT
jgi:hypothetical protein